MGRSEAASYWAQTASGYFESMAARQVAMPQRRNLSSPAASPAVLVAIKACAKEREAGATWSPISLPPTKALVVVEDQTLTAATPSD